MKATWLISGLVMVSACGGSPTAPQPVPQPQTQTAKAPEPPAAEPAPEPVPAPPVPTPEPPKPEPAPTPVQSYQATTGFAQWFGTPAVPGTFAVQIFADSVQFGPLNLSIALNTPDALLLRGSGVTVNMIHVSDTWQWSLNGLAGQASGVMK